MAITETWLTGTERDDGALADIRNILPNFDFFHFPRQTRRGGGVGILVKKGLDVKLNSIDHYDSFEHMDLFISSHSISVRVVIIYRPPKDKNKRSTARLFEMIIYWFFLKNVTFYFTKKLETRCK